MGKQSGRDMNRARAGVTGQGLRTGWQEEAGIRDGQEGRRGRWDGRTKKGRCMHVACLVVAAQQQKA